MIKRYFTLIILFWSVLLSGCAVASSESKGQKTAVEKYSTRLVHANVEFQGVAELHKVEGMPGLRLQRVPEKVRLALNSGAQMRMLAPEGMEIRFVSSGDTVEVTLSAPNGPVEVFPFWGGFQDCETRERRRIIGRKPTTFKLVYPDLKSGRVKSLKRGVCKNHPFKPQVWRLMLTSRLKNPTVYFHEIKGRGIRPPKPSEVPSKCYLAYGTSVTDGFAATAPYMTYVSQTAWRLGTDAVNLGSAGSAYCEPELADYIAACKDWDIATLCISGNMVGAGYTAEQFRERATYMVNTIAASDPNRQVFCITIWPYFPDLCVGTVGNHKLSVVESYRKVLRQIVKDCPYPNVHLIEGSDLLKDFDGYSSDIAHPSDLGMIKIGENLAKRIKQSM